MLSSQKEFVDNVVIQEPLGSSDHNQLHFNINIKSDKTKVKQCRRDFSRAGTNTPSDEYDTYRDTGWRIRYVSRIHFFSEAKLGNG